MEAFIDHMAATLILGAAIGLAISTWVFVGEKIAAKLGLEEKIAALIEK